MLMELIDTPKGWETVGRMLPVITATALISEGHSN